MSLLLAAQLHGVAGWMETVLNALGPPGIGVLILVENLFPPIPSEAVLPAAGFLASRGEFGVVAAAAWATAGSVVGALLIYGVALWVGDDRLSAVIDRVPLMSTKDASRAWDFFDRHGGRAVLLGRLVPGVRSLISVPAGARQMPLVGFTVRTAIGSAAWNVLLIGAGYWLGDAYDTTAQVAGWANRVIYAAFGVAVVWFLAGRIRARLGRAVRRLDEPELGAGRDGVRGPTRLIGHQPPSEAKPKLADGYSSVDAIWSIGMLASRAMSTGVSTFGSRESMKVSKPPTITPKALR